MINLHVDYLALSLCSHQADHGQYWGQGQL